MLELKKIKKDYPAGDGKVEALKGIDLTFRDNEFVSILGPSGCGKTTMLNIIGGLDQYTDGDLKINGKSTKDFKDRDWDTYRNHSIGFVFQSYNLILHQTVLQNVELALTLSGVSKAERRKRAEEALKRVGLSSQLNKKPTEMSGGQMQRVAIARAIVNNPDIILADEPTGALDSETSVQVMEILKEIAHDRLVIMVTHNPELAEKYSSRIIRMLDGEVKDDTNPLSKSELKREKIKDKELAKKNEKVKKPSMSLSTSFSLSLKNLFTKKGRTALTSFAGSIGIIGISLIYAVSQGMTNYINVLQEDTLSSYPLTLESQHMDMGSLMEMFIGEAEKNGTHEKDAVYQKGMIYNLVNAMNNMEANENDLKKFKEHIESKIAESDEDGFKGSVNGIQYTYNMDMLVYTKSTDGTIIRSDTEELMQDLMLEYFGMDMSLMTDMQDSMSGGISMSPQVVLWQEMLSGKNGEVINPVLEKQYDVIYGSWPDEYNEIVLVVDENNEIDDMTLYALGLKTKEEIDKLADAAFNKTTIEADNRSWSYEEICNRDYRVVLNADCYSLDEKTGIYTDLRETETGIKYLYDNGIDLKVTGIIRPSEDAVSTMLTGSIGYTTKLTEYIVENAADSPVISAQLEDEKIDIFTGLPFKESVGDLTDEQKKEEFKSYIGKLKKEDKAATYVKIKSIMGDAELETAVSQTIGSMTRADMETTLIQTFTQQMSMSESDMQGYISAMSDEEITEIFSQMVAEQVKAEYAMQIATQFATMPTDEIIKAFDAEMASYTAEQYNKYYEEILEFSDSTYEENLRDLGYIDLDDPSTINIFASTFENKDVIEEFIADYNKDVEELQQITYTDYIGLMMSSVTSIINAITYVLIAFVAVSLIVSSIMIGVITLISVQERTKEIGILRAIGASKKNVSRMFNAETMIIGFTSGLLGVIVTCLLCIPINMIMHSLTGINNLSAVLPIPVAVILVAISMLLTLISGIIPSRSAAKKDPVVALRSE
ncbi:MAG: ABC transporter ATP-binding protein/permease [Oscillospiraceae bacterium]|nr:ABC transporter ATP-binding protein/permease [Oscillospiraceae bacterium]